MKQYKTSRIRGMSPKGLSVSNAPSSLNAKVSAKSIGPKNVIAEDSTGVKTQTAKDVMVVPATSRKKRPSFFGYIDDPVLGQRLSEEFNEWQARQRK